MTDNPTDKAGGEDDPLAGMSRAARPWLDAITDAQKYFQYWNDKSDNIDKLYADLKGLAETGVDREFQMFWANLEVLKPSIYARPPAPVAVPRWKDQRELPRKASEVLERTLVVNFEQEDINDVMMQVRDDMATNGRGAAWVRLAKGGELLRNRIEHVDRTDFLHEPARKWAEVGWVARRAWLSTEEGTQRFGAEAFAQVNLKGRKEMTGDQEQTDYEGERKGEVWEIWSKARGVVVWVSPGMEEVLDIQPPYLQLEGFFPCPKPAYSTTERRKLIAVPDFVYYKDQLEEINELTARISALAESLRMKGFYPSGAGDLAEAVETAIKSTDQNAVLIPIANFAALGGVALKDSIIWLPVKDVAETIVNLVALRKQLIDDVYQITGLSDIMRGATDANETATAQQLKSQYGSIRIRDRQAELVRIARDLTRISAEIIAENYTAEQFLAMTQMDLPTDQMIQQQIEQFTAQVQQAAASPELQMLAQQDPQQVQQLQQQAQQQLAQMQATVTIDKIVGLFREQKIRPFVLEIETDSTIQPDEQAEKQSRTEFVVALTGMMQQLGPMVASQPALAPFAGETLKFALAPYRAGRALEGAVEQFVETIKGQAQQQMQNPQPSPEQIKAQSEAQKLEFEKQKHADEMQLRTREGNQSHALEVRKAQLEGDKALLEGEEGEDGQHVSLADVIGQLTQQNAGIIQSIQMLAQANAEQTPNGAVVEQLAAQNAAIVQSMQMIARALIMPKQVTTPEGRTYTSQPATVN